MTLTDYESPFTLCPELEEKHLEVLSKMILTVVEITLMSHSTPYDDKYTLETSLFGRIRQLFIQLGKADNFPWVKLPSQTMDYVPTICNVPVRIFKDDPHNPKKLKVFFQNNCEQHQHSLMFEQNEAFPIESITWRILIQEPATEIDKDSELEDIEDDYHVMLVGYDSITKSIISMWRSEANTRAAVISDFDELPKEIPVERNPIHKKSSDNIIEFPKNE